MNIGEFLKSKREQCDVTIEFVAARTKINLNVLKKLENSDIKNLPNKTYVRGFVQSYCKVLDLNFNEAMNSLNYTYDGDEIPSEQEKHNIETEEVIQTNTGYKESVKSSEPAEESQLLNNSIDFLSSLLNNKKFLFYSAVTVICLIFSVSIYRVLKKNIINTVEKVSKEKKEATEIVTKTEPTEDLEKVIAAESKPVPTETAIEPSPVKDKNASLFESEKLKQMRLEHQNVKQKEAEVIARKAKEETIAKVETKEEKKENKKIEERKKDLRKFPERKFYKVRNTALFTVNEKADENDDTDLLPKNIKSKMDEDKQNVYIVAVDGDTWISYKKDDADIVSRLIKKGKAILLQAGLVRMFLGNINVTKIFYNNKLIEIDSKTGVKSLIFPEDRKTEFELPLFVPNADRVLYTAEQYKEKMEEETKKFLDEKDN